MAQVSRALVSVADKRGAAEFVAGLDALGIEVISTGGTARLLRQKGIRVIDVPDVTGFPEILNGRFKTLHPLLHCAILALRDTPRHMAELEQHGGRPIDLVVVNLMPFETTASRADCTVEEAIETIDIGGPALVRSAAKNHEWVTVVTDPDDYDRVLKELRDTASVPATLRAELALKAFRLSAHYDRAIAAYLASNIEGRFPASLSLDFAKVQELRYGENAHQAAALYREQAPTEPSAGTAVAVSGATALSYNNLVDLDVALELIKEFDGPAATVIKHANPCAVAVADSLAEAIDRARTTDPLAACGGVLALNRHVDAAIAERIVAPDDTPQPAHLELIAAPDFDDEALAIIATRPTWGAHVRVMRTGQWTRNDVDAKAYDLKRVVGGLLVQDRNLALFAQGFRTVTDAQPNETVWRDLRFAAACAKHVRSVAIVLARDLAMIGAGAGQMNATDAIAMACHKAGPRAKGAVLASDAFLRSTDVVAAAADAGCTAIIQPGGGDNDQAVIDKANALGLTMVFSGIRHIRR